MSDWKPLLARITLFPIAPSGPIPSALQVYKAAWGSDPDHLQGSQNPLAPSVARGKRNTFTVMCMVHQLRIDLQLLPSPPDNAENPQLPVLQDAVEVRAELDRLVTVIKAGLVSNDVARVAVFLQLGVPQEGWRGTNAALMSVIPERLRPQLTDEEEFVMQVNDPTMVAHGPHNIRLNCIKKWSAERFQFISLVLPVSPGVSFDGAGLSASPVVEITAASLALDVNNVPDGHALSTDEQNSLLLRSLTEISKAIAESGMKVEGF